MKVFPTTEKKFKLIDNQETTIGRLKRRSDESVSLISAQTDKSFRGTINGNEFELISSEVGKGIFCVMSGEINSESGIVKVEIHKVVRVLAIILYVLPLVGFSLTIYSEDIEALPIFILVLIAQVLMIRFLFIGLAFKFLSKRSLNKLRDVADLEWV